MRRSWWRRPRRVLSLAGAVLVLVVLSGGACGAWYVSGQIGCGLLEPRRIALEFQVQIVEVTDDELTLRATYETGYCSSTNDNWQKPGLWGLHWLGGYSELVELRDVHEGVRTAVWTWRPVRGTPRVGAFARFESLIYADDPLLAHGIEFSDVSYPGEGGDYPAWFTAGDDDTWVIFVHGKGASRRDALRVLPLFVELGFPTLTISYRNDVAAPGGESERYAYGETEWRDLEAAVRWARQQGASDVVLFGASMGGAVVVSFLLQSSEAEHVPGAILDAPTLDIGGTVDFNLRDAGIPGFLTWAPIWLAELRYGVDFGAVDWMERVDELETPLLLFHGTEDDHVPVEVSDDLADARPDLVDYERFEGAHHTRAWNLAPDRYEAALAAFLERVGR